MLESENFKQREKGKTNAFSCTLQAHKTDLKALVNFVKGDSYLGKYKLVLSLVLFGAF